MSNFEIYAQKKPCSPYHGGLVVLESHRREAFCQLYARDGKPHGEPFQTDAKNLISCLPLWENMWLAGNAAFMIDELLKDKRYNFQKIEMEGASGASRLGQLCLDMIKKETLPDITKKHPAMPFYIRPPDVTFPKGKVKK